MQRLTALMEQAGSGDLSVRFTEKTKRRDWAAGQPVQLAACTDSGFDSTSQGQGKAEATGGDGRPCRPRSIRIFSTIPWIPFNGRPWNMGADEAADMIQALSKFFRHSLNQGKEWIRLENEVQQIQNYLFIQKIRYEERLQFEVDCRGGHELGIAQAGFAAFGRKCDLPWPSNPRRRAVRFELRFVKKPCGWRLRSATPGSAWSRRLCEGWRESLEGTGEDLGVGLKKRPAKAAIGLWGGLRHYPCFVRNRWNTH